MTKYKRQEKEIKELKEKVKARRKQTLDKFDEVFKLLVDNEK